jgi:predicted dienelactone hydrolase
MTPYRSPRLLRALLAIATTLWLFAACDDGDATQAATDTSTTLEDTSATLEDTSATLEDTSATLEDTSATLEDTSDTQDDAADTSTARPQIDQPPAPPWNITERGPYNVGYTRLYVSYVPKGRTEPRRIRIAMWYPTRDATGSSSKYFNLFQRAEAFSEASLPDDPWLAQMPLLVFSHGNASLAEQSYFMTEFFASHGWIVASPDHTENTFADTGGAINVASAPLRPQDISHVIDQMLTLLPDGHRLKGRSDPDLIAMSGHSFGAITTTMVGGASFDLDVLLARCEDGSLSGRYCELLEDTTQYDAYRDGFLDDRVKVIIPMTAGAATVFQEGFGDIPMPTLLFTGEMDHSLENAEEGDPIWGWLNNVEDARVNFFTAGHFTFSNMCDLLGSIEMVFNDGCDTSIFINPADAYGVINHYSMAFIRLHMFNEQQYLPLFDGTEAPYSDILEVENKR